MSQKAKTMLEATVRDNQELSQLIQQVTSKREAITLVQEGQQKAVLLSLEMFQALIEISVRREQLSVKGFAAMSRQLFTKSGYDSPEKIIELIQEIKQELSTEREQRLNDGKINV
jgi:PHD/YefM family antitoxin component YafN of YafNO toxin-antitoxin module